MKRFFILMFFISFFPTFATAIDMCSSMIGMSGGVTCSSVTANTGRELYGNCTYNGISFIMRGVVGCFDNTGTQYTTTIDTPTINTTDNVRNNYCYFKLTSPGVSKWILAYSFPDQYYCLRDCASTTANYIKNLSTYWELGSTLTSNLSN